MAQEPTRISLKVHGAFEVQIDAPKGWREGDELLWVDDVVPRLNPEQFHPKEMEFEGMEIEAVVEPYEEALLREFIDYLIKDTDTFDPVMVRMAIESGILKPNQEQIDQWVEHFMDKER